MKYIRKLNLSRIMINVKTILKVLYNIKKIKVFTIGIWDNI
jgi:5-bromo-4-chloroindolyl phosphate hydrolysis protein